MATSDTVLRKCFPFLIIANEEVNKSRIYCWGGKFFLFQCSYWSKNETDIRQINRNQITFVFTGTPHM